MTAGRADPGAEGGPPRDAVEVVTRSPAPTLLLELPSERIVAASPTAGQLLSPGGEDIVGRSLEDFTKDAPTGALELLAAGRLNGYDTSRVLVRGGVEIPLHAWVRAIDSHGPRRYVLCVLSTDRIETHRPPPTAAESDVRPMFGAADDKLLVDRVSTDIQVGLGYPPEEVIGGSLLQLWQSESVPTILWALAQATSSGAGVTAQVWARSRAGAAVPGYLLLLPLVPAPSSAFAFLAGADPAEGGLSHEAAEQLLWRLGRGVELVTLSRGLSDLPAADRHRLRRLSSRELSVLTRLLSGDRVPAIARSLFLSQGTVRNHLTSIFRKLGVGSQQELVDLFRPDRREP